MRETTRITKIYMCPCGAQNRFELETDLGVDGLQAKARCQGCGEEINIAFGNSINGLANGINGILAPSTQVQNGYQAIQGGQNGCQTQYQPQSQTSPAASTAAAISQSLSMFDDPLALAAAAPSITQEQAAQPATAASLPLEQLVDPQAPNSGSGVNSTALGVQEQQTQHVGNPQMQTDDVRKKARSALEVYVESEEDALSGGENASEHGGEQPTAEEEQALRDLFGKL